MNHPHRSLGAVFTTLVPIGLTAAALALGACSSSASQPQSAAEVNSNRADAVARLDASTAAVTAFRTDVSEDVTSRARCVVTVPALKTGGLIVGGTSGRGFATCRTAKGWSAPAPIKVGGGTFGAQIGYQSADLLALVMSDKAMATLEAGEVKVGGDVSAAAGPVGTGRGMQFGDTEILSYSRSSGLFAGATLSGTSIDADQETLEAMYGRSATLGNVLRGQISPAMQEPAVGRFMGAVREVFPPGAAVSMTP